MNVEYLIECSSAEARVPSLLLEVAEVGGDRDPSPVWVWLLLHRLKGRRIQSPEASLLTAMTELEVYGPFDIPCDKNGERKWIGKNHGTEFWSQPAVADLRMKQGCYVFATRASKGFKPWYIGKATKAFAQEVFTPHKRGDHYNTVLQRGVKGSPVLFLIARPGARHKIPKLEIRDLEKFLIEHGVYRNKELSNVKNTKSIPRWSISGVVRSGKGRRSSAAGKFKTMMRL